MSNEPLQRRSKTALVLAGGGLAAMVYEAGALQALDTMLVNSSVNDFDIYVGTSAGSVVASLLANGLNPEAILQTVDGSHPQMQPIMRRDVWRLDARRFLGRMLGTPERLIGSGRRYLEDTRDITLFNVLYVLLEVLPTAIYHSDALEAFTRRILTDLDLANDFRALDPELHIIATRLSTGERAVFNRESDPGIRISQAVAASSSVPVLYNPYRIQGSDYVDGAVRGNASLDVAVERGAELVVCINPLVPYDNSTRASIPNVSEHTEGAALSDTNMQTVVNQVLRIWIHAGLHYHLKQLRRAHPEVDFVLIEPDPSDYQLSFANVMRYAEHVEIAQHAQGTVWKRLHEDFSELAPLLAKHGLTLRDLTAVNAESDDSTEGEREQAANNLLFTTPADMVAVLSGNGETDIEQEDEDANEVLRRLQQSLDKLEDALKDDVI